MVFTMLPELEMMAAEPGWKASSGLSPPTAPMRTWSRLLMMPRVLQPTTSMLSRLQIWRILAVTSMETCSVMM